MVTTYLKNLLEQDFQNNLPPLKDHHPIPTLFDILGRRQQHHVILKSSHSKKINAELLNGLAYHFASENNLLPKNLRDNLFISLDLQNLSNDIQLEQSLQTLFAEPKQKILAIDGMEYVLNNLSLFPATMQLIKSILTNHHWRLIIFASTHILRQLSKQFPFINDYFSIATFNEITANEAIAILKTFRPALEEFHQALIPEELFAQAYAWACHYLPGSCHLEKALQLLDSAAARANSQEKTLHNAIVTHQLIIQVVATWTGIPLNYLQQNKFQAEVLINAVKKSVFGQDKAIELIGLLLQNACLKLEEKNGPLTTLLLVGPKDSGKTTIAQSIAENLFGYQQALLHVNLSQTHYTCLSEVYIVPPSEHQHCISFLDAVRQTPYAVVLLENIDQLSASQLDLFKDIFFRGYVFDKNGQSYDFRHTIFVMTTRLGAKNTHQLALEEQPEAGQAVDLMQLVLNNLPPLERHNGATSSLNILRDELLPILEAHFSPALLQQWHIIPLTSLDYAAVEKVIRLKLKMLSKQLEIKFNIELSYAPEIIKFLAYETFWNACRTKSFKQRLEEHLYSCVTNEILTANDGKNNSKKLLLRLNDAGELLRCEFVTTNATAFY